MVFSTKGDFHELDCDRYSTEAEALRGHEQMCTKWLAENPEAEAT